MLVLDHLDAVAPDRARDILEMARRSLGAGNVALVALDPERHEASVLERCIDLPIYVAATEQPGALVAGLLGRAVDTKGPAKPNAAASSLDEPLDPAEGDMLVGVAPLAGNTPRALRRFVNLYRLARADGDAPRGALAFALALDLGGTRIEEEAVARAIGAGPAGFELPTGSSARLLAARDAANAFGHPLGEGSMAAARRQARRFAFDPRTEPAR